jgi:hypothetical protein
MTADASRSDCAKVRAGAAPRGAGPLPGQEAVLAHCVKQDAAYAGVNHASVRVEIGFGRHVLGSDASQRPMMREMMRQPAVFGSRRRDVQNPQPRASMVLAGHGASPISDHGDFRCNTF